MYNQWEDDTEFREGCAVAIRLSAHKRAWVVHLLLRHCTCSLRDPRGPTGLKHHICFFTPTSYDDSLLLFKWQTQTDLPQGLQGRSELIHRVKGGVPEMGAWPRLSISGMALMPNYAPEQVCLKAHRAGGRGGAKQENVHCRRLEMRKDLRRSPVLLCGPTLSHWRTSSVIWCCSFPLLFFSLHGLNQNLSRNQNLQLRGGKMYFRNKIKKHWNLPTWWLKVTSLLILVLGKKRFAQWYIYLFILVREVQIGLAGRVACAQARGDVRFKVIIITKSSDWKILHSLYNYIISNDLF